MMTEYDLPLVIASFLVAVLAAYAALYFGARLTSTAGAERQRWLVAGGLLMGTGVWTMHFVGMRAMPMAVPMTFDTLMTAASWLAAVTASGLALHIIGRPQLGKGLFVSATLAMAGGIVVMHYLGMYAMRMSAPPEFNLGLLALSVGIAVAASGSALALCRKLQKMEGASALAVQFVAAMAMAAAICGMHYTGMLAMTFPESAVPAADNGLRGEWMGIPLAVFCIALLAVALVVTVLDIGHRRELAERRTQEDRRVAELAFVDAVTGLPNRSALEQRLLEVLAREGARQHPFALIYLDVANFRELSTSMGTESLNAVVNEISQSLRDHLSEGVFLSRYSASGFFALVPDHKDARHAFMYKRLRQIDQRIGTEAMPVTWRAGQSAFPVSGNSTRKLIRAAMVPADLNEIGRFAGMTVSPELVLPGQTLGS
ncbi:MHYT domain-containing protein [Marinobacter subterrani]|nr:MHYT domain-containing protein [Marinobacter subterrani]